MFNAVSLKSMFIINEFTSVLHTVLGRYGETEDGALAGLYGGGGPGAGGAGGGHTGVAL